MKNKKNIIVGVAGLLGLAYGLVSVVKTQKKMEMMNDRLVDLAKRHNGLCIHTDNKIRELEEGFEENRAEIVDCYDHIESLTELIIK